MSIKTKAEDVKIVKSAFLLASFSVKKNHKTEEGKHNKRRVFLKHLYLLSCGMKMLVGVTAEWEVNGTVEGALTAPYSS